jgi:hypothetical protein
MDFVERIFGLSPDGGSGLYEWMLLATVPILIAVVVWRIRGRKSRRR